MLRTKLTGAAAAAGLLLSTSAAFAQTETPTTNSPAQAQPAAPAASASTFTEVQLRSFAEASVEIERARQGATASGGPTEESRSQIRSILERHQLTAENYNGIVAAVQADPALAQQVQALRATASATAAPSAGATTNQ